MLVPKVKTPWSPSTKRDEFVTPGCYNSVGPDLLVQKSEASNIEMTTAETIKSILKARSLDSLVGLKEDLWFDAKDLPGYDFSTPHGRIELAKDVSGFANAEGGYILIGLKTKVLVEENTEVVSLLNLFSQADFDTARFRGLIKEHVFPEIVGLDVQWVETLAAAGQGIGTIWVPPQEETKKFFLMNRVIEDGHQLRQIVFGISKRVGSSTEPITIKQIYAMTQRGNSDEAQRLSRIEDNLSSVLHTLSKQTSQPLSGVDIEEKIKKIIDS